MPTPIVTDVSLDISENCDKHYAVLRWKRKGDQFYVRVLFPTLTHATTVLVKLPRVNVMPWHRVRRLDLLVPTNWKAFQAAREIAIQSNLRELALDVYEAAEIKS